MGLDDFDHETNDGAGGIERTAALALRECELTEEVFVDLAEDVARRIVGNVIELTEQIEGRCFI